MSARHPDSICTFPDGRQNKFRTHSSGAGDPDNADIGRILHSAYTGKISRAITAPITKKTGYFYFIFTH